MKVFLNDKIIPEEEASISIWDRGFLLGDGVFETVKFTQGRVEFWEDHYNRWVNSCKTTGIPLPYEKDQVEEIITELCQQNDLSEAVVRLTLSRGVGGPGLSFPKNPKPTLLITTTAISFDYQKLKKEGLSATLYLKEGHSESSDLGHVKATNYLMNVMAKNFAESKGFDEALFIDAQNRVLEFTTANVFYSINGVWASPPLHLGILPGTIRQRLFKGFDSSKTKVIERELRVEELSEVEEILMCSSVRGLVSIHRLDTQKLLVNGPLYEACETLLAHQKKI